LEIRLLFSSVISLDFLCTYFSQAVTDRERTAAKMSAELSQAQTRLETLRSKKNVAVNDVEVVLTLPRGQVEESENGFQVILKIKIFDLKVFFQGIVGTFYSTITCNLQ